MRAGQVLDKEELVGESQASPTSPPTRDGSQASKQVQKISPASGRPP